MAFHYETIRARPLNIMFHFSCFMFTHTKRTLCDLLKASAAHAYTCYCDTMVLKFQFVSHSILLYVDENERQKLSALRTSLGLTESKMEQKLMQLQVHHEGQIIAFLNNIFFHDIVMKRMLHTVVHPKISKHSLQILFVIL